MALSLEATRRWFFYLINSAGWMRWKLEMVSQGELRKGLEEIGVEMDPASFKALVGLLVFFAVAVGRCGQFALEMKVRSSFRALCIFLACGSCWKGHLKYRHS